MRIGSLTSSHSIGWTSVKTTKHSCSDINTNPTTSVEFGRRSTTWSKKNNGLGLYSSTTTTRSTRNPYKSWWIEIRKKSLKDYVHNREYGDRYYRGDGGGGGDGDGGGNDDDDDEGDDEDDDNARKEELAIPIIKFEEVMKEIESRGASLNVFASDVLDFVRKEGIRINILSRYLDLQEKGWLLAFLMRHCSFVRDRMLADPDFLSNLTTELAVYSLGSTFGELYKRGKDFGAEFELYASDLFVGLLVNSVVVSLFAPIVPIGQQNFIGRMLQPIFAFTTHYWDSKYTYIDPSNFLIVVVIYGVVGASCSFIGQGIANQIMTARRKIMKSNGDVPVPDLRDTAELWGVYSGCDLSIRNLCITGVGKLIGKPIFGKVPASLALNTTLGKLIGEPILGKVPASLTQAFYITLQFASSFYGSVELIRMAKKQGIQ